jgi:hypothetical protein
LLAFGTLIFFLFLTLSVYKQKVIVVTYIYTKGVE